MKKPLNLPKFKNEDEERANELNMPYQSLIKQYIAKGVVREQKERELA
jgi:hypothetical protein